MNGDNIIKIDICGSCFLLIDMRLERVIGLRECLLKTDKIRWQEFGSCISNVNSGKQYSDQLIKLISWIENSLPFPWFHSYQETSPNGVFFSSFSLSHNLDIFHWAKNVPSFCVFRILFWAVSSANFVRKLQRLKSERERERKREAREKLEGEVDSESLGVKNNGTSQQSRFFSPLIPQRRRNGRS